MAAHVPSQVTFATKNEIARTQTKAALKAGIPRGAVLGDAADTALCDWLSEQTSPMRWGCAPAPRSGEHQPVAAPTADKRGKAKTPLTRDKNHPPISVLALAKALAPQCFRMVTWREGVSEPQRCSRYRSRPRHRRSARLHLARTLRCAGAGRLAAAGCRRNHGRGCC